MKALRVLAGVHAGAGLSLAPGRYRIAGTPSESTIDQADIPVTLIDWSTPPLVLMCTADGPPVTQALGDDASTSAWPDFEVRRFGDVVLCIGEADAQWPGDAELLARLTGTSPSRSPQRTSRLAASWGTRAGFIGAGLLVVVGALYGRSGGAPLAPPALRPDFGAELLSRSLVERGLHELTVNVQRVEIVLSGLVRNADEAQAVRLATADIERRTGVPVAAHWEIADDIASTIEAALRQPGVRARYSGAGRFLVEGIVPDPGVLKASGAPLATDLGANVKGIDFALERKTHAVLFSSAIAADGLRYTERPDGAKVFSKNPQEM